jgi:hypothetical protein
VFIGASLVIIDLKYKSRWFDAPAVVIGLMQQSTILIILIRGGICNNIHLLHPTSSSPRIITSPSNKIKTRVDVSSTPEKNPDPQLGGKCHHDFTSFAIDGILSTVLNDNTNNDIERICNYWWHVIVDNEN